MSALLTASTIERAEWCPVSFSLPQVSNTTEAATRGTSIHEYLRRRLRGEDAAACLERVDEKYRDTCRGIDVPMLTGDFSMIRSEVAFVINVDTRTVRALGTNIARKYGEIAPWEIPGTLDVQGVLTNGRSIAGDFKTGFRNVAPVVGHRQVQFEVLATAMVHVVDECADTSVEGRIWKVLDSGEVKVDRHVFDTFELDEIADDFRRIYAGVLDARDDFQANEKISLTPGDWCRYCPALEICPAKVERARALAGDMGAIVASLAKLTPEQEWLAWTKYKEADELVDTIGKALRDIAGNRYMTGSPIRSPDGLREVRPVESTRSDFSRELALALLRELGAEEDQIRKLFIPKTIESYRTCKVKGAKAPKKLRGRAALEARAFEPGDEVDRGDPTWDTSPTKNELLRIKAE